MGLSRNNHYLAQMYLDAWKNDENKVCVYHLLVPNENVPLWKYKSTRSVGSEDNFYITLNDVNDETDTFEKEFNKKYETPAMIPLKKAINGERLSIDDWHILIEFVACSIVRTPSFLLKVLTDGNNKYAATFQKEIDNISKKISNIKVEDLKTEKNPKENYDLFPIKFTNMGEGDNKDTSIIKIETIIGKQFYFFIIDHLLKNTVKVLHSHKWSIIEMDDNVVLPTSDSPVICLNYNNYEDYNFGGGWGRKNTNIIFPISPNKVMFTQVGVKCKPRMKADYKFSLFIKKIIIEHSHRVIISKAEDTDIIRKKRRYVSLKEYKREKKVWSDFHKEYLEKESEYINPSNRKINRDK